MMENSAESLSFIYLRLTSDCVEKYVCVSDAYMCVSVCVCVCVCGYVCMCVVCMLKYLCVSAVCVIYVFAWL